MPKDNIAPHPVPWRAAIHRVIFGFDTLGGKLFDVALLVLILVSITSVSLETVKSIDQQAHGILVALEWFATGMFTFEYFLRLLCVAKPLRYARSFFGIVDLLSFLPTYLVPLIPGSQMLFVLRSLRLLRVFRILELAQFMSEAESLSRAIWNARAKVVVFLITVLIAVTIAGTGMYVVERDVEDSQFTSIPQSMYWAVVTMTTVGYGDVVPQTTPGKILSAALILLGYSLIIVPTGFVSAEMVSGRKQEVVGKPCSQCGSTRHLSDAEFCAQCGTKLSRQ